MQAGFRLRPPLTPGINIRPDQTGKSWCKLTQDAPKIGPAASRLQVTTASLIYIRQLLTIYFTCRSNQEYVSDGSDDEIHVYIQPVYKRNVNA